MERHCSKVVQVVKRFGLCGGMEEYVYRLSEHLVLLGLKVSILCEEKVNYPEDCKINVVELGRTRKKPRWLSHLLFAQKVEKWVQVHQDEKSIIHSHERICCHHITTIHSTLFNFPRKTGLPSLRKFFNEKLEKSEINNQSVSCVVPVSKVIGDQIEQKFPNSIYKLSKPINPGIDEIFPKKSERIENESFRLGFIGEEWKRKGLPKVIEIWRLLVKKGVDCQLVLAGFSQAENIGLSRTEIGNVKILGWLSDKSKFYSNIDILLHPAKREAYGMVIAESASLGIPFVCSNECGASTLAREGYGKAVPESAPTKTWVEQLISLISLEPSGEFYQRPWSNVAKEYADLYEKIQPSSNRIEHMQ